MPRRRHVDPTHAALITDMQRESLEPGFGAALGNVSAQGAGHRPDLADAPRDEVDARRPHRTGAPVRWGLVCREAGDDILPQLHAISGWQVIDKPGKGAFHQAPELAPRNRVDTGLTTEVCVTTTAREAMRLSCFRIAAARLNVPERPQDDHGHGDIFDSSGILAQAARRHNWPSRGMPIN
jgi:nicotinamidase-related amidase